MTVQLALRTVSLESRRDDELASLLRRRGFSVIRAPSLREVPLEDQGQAIAFGQALFAGECDVLVLLTGVGTSALVGALETRWERAAVLDALRRTVLACRGPKPVAVLKELGLKPSVTAPEPNTWHELARSLEAVDLRRKRVWIQEYGRPNDELVEVLRARGADVHRAAVYAWGLPEDTGPLEAAVDALCDHSADAVVFTSARQIDHLLEVAGRRAQREALLGVLRSDVLVLSIGPVTSAALRAHAIRADLEPVHPKMGHLVKLFAEEGLRALELKRGINRSNG